MTKFAVLIAKGENRRRHLHRQLSGCMKHESEQLLHGVDVLVLISLMQFEPHFFLDRQKCDETGKGRWSEVSGGFI